MITQPAFGTPRSVAIRTALRQFITSHAEYKRESHDPTRLTKTELCQLVRVLGGDPDDISRRIIAALGVADRTAPSQPTPTQPQPKQDNAAPMPDSNMTTTTAAPAPDAAAPDAAAIKAQLDRMNVQLVEGGFAAIRSEVGALIVAAAKPAEVRIIQLQAEPTLPQGVHNLRPARAATWGELFNMPAGTPAAARPITVWDHPNAPKPNPAYVWPLAETALVLTQLARGEAARAKQQPGKHPLLYGPAGTGKSAWTREFAARTGRPYTCISCSDGVEIDQLMGQRVLDGQGGTAWADGILLAAMRQPGMVICLDELGALRHSVALALNALLQDMAFYVPDTGERVAVARGVVFIGTNNANLATSGAAAGYHGITRQNAAFADRFCVSVEIAYPPAASEAALLATYTGCTAALATLLVDVATLSRARAASDDITRGIGFRRLLSWAELLTDGVDADNAFRAAVLNTAPAQDVEILRQLALVAVDPNAIRRALATTTTATTTTQEG